MPDSSSDQTTQQNFSKDPLKKVRSFSPHEDEDTEMRDPSQPQDPNLKENKSKNSAWLVSANKEHSNAAWNTFNTSSKSLQDKALLDRTLKELQDRLTSFKQLPEIPMTRLDAAISTTDVYRRRKDLRADSLG